MRHLLLSLLLALPLSVAAQAPCPAGDCPCILRKADRAATDPKSFKHALDLYFAVTACDGALRDTVEERIAALFARIEKLRVEAENAKKLAQTRQKQARAAQLRSDSLYEVAEAQRAKAEAVLDKIYFYEDRYGLAYDKSTNRYGFIDKNLQTKIAFTYTEALPFEYTGYAKVKKGGLYYLIDTTGAEFLLATDLNQLTPKVTALDLRGKNLGKIPDTVFAQTQLKVLLLNSNQLSSLPVEIGQLKNLESLDLSSNQLSDLPVEIGQLESLQWLNLSYN
jgi:hypothetical protein